MVFIKYRFWLPCPKSKANKQCSFALSTYNLTEKKMKKMFSLAAMLAVLSYASPASAEVKISGDAGIRARAEFKNNSNSDDLKYQYRVRLKAAADLGDGFFFNALAQNEEAGGAWTTVTGSPAIITPVGAGVTNNTERYPFQLSNFYFGRTQGCCQYKVGRLPLNSASNPIFDLAFYPIPTAFTHAGIYAVDTPVSTNNFDRLAGANYSTKVGDGDLNTTLLLLDNNSITANTAATGDGLLNDGYALHVSYTTKLGDVTIQPQALISLTDVQGAVYRKVSPHTFGANASFLPTGNSKVSASAFYTTCKDSKGTNAAGTTVNVDYNGYLVRLKGESGPITAWVDYNNTKDNLTAVTYDNTFVWAQYNVKIHQLSNGTANVNVTPTLRYRTSGKTGVANNDLLRGELYATVTF
jgi:hypothetical protein